MTLGHVWLVGAGPGDPGLITVNGLAALRRADVVVYDRLAPHELLDEAPAQALRIDAGKSAGDHTLTQEEINALLVEHGIPATKIGSSGGFLRRGNVTIFSGVEDTQVNAVLDIVNEICPARTELVPVQTLPFIGDTAFSAEPIEVRAGGATIFVMNVERFQRI